VPPEQERNDVAVSQRLPASELDKWFARVACGDKRVYLSAFDDEVEAARARDRAAIERHGEFASLHFPEERDAPTADEPAAPPA